MRFPKTDSILKTQRTYPNSVHVRYRHLFKDFDFQVSDNEVAGRFSVSFDGKEGNNLFIEASKPGTWVFKLTPDIDINTGDVVAFAREFPSHGFEGYRLALRPQTFNPLGLDYVTATTRSGAKLGITANRFNVKGREIALIEVEEGQVPCGETITLKVGDKSEGGPGSFAWPVARMDCRLFAYLKTPVDDSYSPFSSKVHITTRPAVEPKRLQVVAPSDVISDEPFTLKVVIRDFNANILDGFKGTIHVESAGDEHPVHLNIDADTSIVRIPVIFKELGIRWLRVKIGDLIQLSNPIRVHDKEPIFRTYWGDIHAHCYDASEINVLDEISSPRSVLLSGRDENMIDVCAASPHYFPWDSGAIDKWWSILMDGCRELNSDAEFVTFPCLEYRGQGGDRNLLFLTEWKNPPYMNETLEPIWRLSPKKVAVLPHVGGGTSDWSLHKPILEPSAEVASAHGNFEWFLQDGLSRGAHVGVHCSSDGHNRTAGHPRHVQMGGGRFGDLNRRDCSYGGASLAAFNSPTLDREGIWTALASRSTYGCTEARMLISFEIEGHQMGSIVRADHPPMIRSWAAGAAPIARLETIRDDRILHVHRGRSFVESDKLKDKGIQPGRHYYYLRVTQADGEIAWSSPIWVYYEGRKRKGVKLPRWNRQELLHRREPTENSRVQFGRLKAYLEREEEDRFYGLRWTHDEDSPQGHYHYFVGHDRKRGTPIHIKWYTDFPDERLRVDTGWRDYGQWGKRRTSNLKASGTPGGMRLLE